jgi:hypothetical protein
MPSRTPRSRAYRIDVAVVGRIKGRSREPLGGQPLVDEGLPAGVQGAQVQQGPAVAVQDVSIDQAPRHRSDRHEPGQGDRCFTREALNQPVRIL